MAESTDNPSAVYVAFATFSNALDQLSQGVPNRVDRSVFPGLSGGVQAQLLAGMRFLGLIDSSGKPQPSLSKLAVTDESVRQRELRVVLEDSYPDLFALDLTKTTPAQLGEEMAESYNVSGDTREKALRFFLSAADYAGVTLSPLLQKKKRARSASSGSSSPRRRKTNRSRSASTNAAPSSTNGTSKIVQLKSGGELILSAKIDFLSISAEDREFVFELIDRMDSYDSADAEEIGTEE